MARHVRRTAGIGGFLLVSLGVIAAGVLRRVHRQRGIRRLDRRGARHEDRGRRDR